MANVIFSNLEDTAANITASKRPLLIAFDATNKKLKYYDASTVEYEAFTLDATGTPTRTIGDLTTGALTSVGDVNIGADASNALVITNTYMYLLANGEKIIDYLHANGYIAINAGSADVDTDIYGTDAVTPVVHVGAGDNRLGIGTITPAELLEAAGAAAIGDVGVSTNSEVAARPRVNKYLGETADSVANYILLCKTLTAAGTFAATGFDGVFDLYRGKTSFYNNAIKIEVSAKNAYSDVVINKFNVYAGKENIPTDIDLVTVDYDGINYLAIRISTMSAHATFYSGRYWGSAPSIVSGVGVTNILVSREVNIGTGYNGNVGIGTTAPASLTEIQGGLTTEGAVLTLSTKETTVVSSYVLGKIAFRAPLEASGGDAVLNGAAIAAVAEDTFSATVNKTSLEFRTGESEAATTKMTIKSDGKINMGTTTATEKLNVAGRIKCGDVVIDGGEFDTSTVTGLISGINDAIDVIGPAATSAGQRAEVGLDRALTQPYGLTTDAIITPVKKQLTDGSAVSLFEVALPTSGNTCGGMFSYRIHCWNGTDFQSVCGIANYAAGNKAGTITSAIGHTAVGSGIETEIVSSGTMTDTFAITNGTGKITVTLNANTSLTPSANELYVTYTLHNDSEMAVTIL